MCIDGLSAYVDMAPQHYPNQIKLLSLTQITNVDI